MSFKYVTGDLIRLVETPKEKLASQLEAIGGVQGVAEKLNVNLQQGLSTLNEEDLKQREDHFGRNYVPPPKAKSIFELMWDAFQDITIIVLTIAGASSIVLTMVFDEEHRDTGWIEGTVIIFAVLLVVVVTAMNDYQKEKQFRSLNAVKEDEKIKVIRDGSASEVSKWNLVVGDIVRIELGDIVPADGILIKGKELKMDESAMTGESDLLAKNEKSPFILSGTKVMEGFGQMLVICVGENSQAGIIKTLINGKRQQEGKIQSSVATTAGQTTADGEVYVELETPRSQSNRSQSHADQHEVYDDDDEPQSPLEGKLYKLTVLIGQLGTITALIVFFAMSIRFSITKFLVEDSGWEGKYITDYLGFFIVSITVLVVAIPEGLPLAVTISLAYSVKKMLKDNNLVRHLNACETMGSATTVCSDKTGTLTTNRMTVMTMWIGGKEYSKAIEAQKDMNENTQTALFNGIAINSTAEILPPKVEGGHPEHTGSKTECALLQFGCDAGVDYTKVRQTHEIIHMLTFSSAKKRMSVVTKLSESKSRIYTKGATEVVLALCSNIQNLDGTIKPLENNYRNEIGNDVIIKYASQGYRTICLAYRDVDCPAEKLSEWTDESIERDLTCIAIVGIEDPVRDEVPHAIELCASAGVTVRMVTGDNINTARTIAYKCGIIKPGDGSLVMEGQEFRNRVLDRNGNIDQDEFNKVWPMLRVLARSSPKDKYTLVSGLMQTTLVPHGPQVVAVTGDGTNDAPALKKANVGFAMGISGTAVAKDASDIILMDDNFNSIVSAIKWGRNVYDSISKFLQFQLTVNIVAITLAVLGAIAIEQSPLTAVQMLWVNLIMDTFASLALATEEPTDALLTRKPYPKTTPLVSKKMTKHLIGQSIFQLIVLCLLTFFGHKWFGIKSGLVADIEERGESRRDPTQHMTIVFNTFVWSQLFNELNCRKIHDEMNIFDGILRNKVFIVICILQVILQVIIVQFGGIYLNCEGLSITQWIVCILLGSLSLPLGAILRSISVKNGPSWMAICREADVSEIKDRSARGQELWIRGINRVRTQLRVVRAFQNGVANGSRLQIAIRES